MRRIWLSGIGSSIASGFTGTLSSHGYVTEDVPTDNFRTLRQDTTPTAIVMSVVDTGLHGLNFLVSARKAVPRIPVLVLVGSDQAKVAVEALKLGATEVCVMPVNPADLLSALRKTQENQRTSVTEPENSRQSGLDTAVFLSRSPSMLEMWNVAARVARSDVPVLILGESGVGKEVLARFIQRHSRRADKPLVKVNCAAVPGDLLESELFGYDRGAFTGAIGEKPGKFELANGGCILLDEIG